MYHRAKPAEEIPMEDIAVWSCTKDDCKGWMRDNFSFEHLPTCRLCDSPMASGTKLLPALSYPNVDQKRRAD